MADARDAFAKHEYERAAKLFGAIAEGPERCEASLYEGLSLQRSGRMNEAIVVLQSASSCGNTADPHLGLAQAWIAKGDDNRAAAALESALRIDGHNKEALRSLGALYLRHEVNDKAAVALQRLVSESPGDANAHADLGAALAGLLDYGRAQTEFQEALKIDSKHPGALLGLANTLIKSSQADQAIPLLNRAIQVRPSAYEPYFLRGTALNAMQQPASALEDFTQALKLGGEDPDILYQLSRAYRALGREAESRNALTRFSAARRKTQAGDESRREASRLLAEAAPLVNKGDLAAAIRLVRRASELDPRNPSVLFRLAGLLYDTRSFDEAQTTIRRALDLAPSEWMYHYLNGLIDAGSGRLEAAQASLETAARLHPASADVYNALGTVAMRRRDVGLGIRSFEKAVELNPADAAFRANLESARTASGRD